jgi:hypothetical protein
MIVQYGTVGGIAVKGNCGADTLAKLQTVTLSSDYARAPPPGYPVPNAGRQAKPDLYGYPQILPSGTVLTLFADEAGALVLAGFAS